MNKDENIFEIRIPTENFNEAKESLNLDEIEFSGEEQGDETVVKVTKPTQDQIVRLKTTERLYSGM